MNKIKFEVCCGSTDDAYNAAVGGADRIELNSALFLGGLTPSIGTLVCSKSIITIPIMAMVRPREGGFCYTEKEYMTMKEDAKRLLDVGADGLVFGFLNADGTINEARTQEFVSICGDKEAVFSRAIDLCPNIVDSAVLLSNLGIKRILTSGGKASAILGAETIKKLVKASKMEVLPGAGINLQNVLELISRTGVTQVHSSARRLYYDTSVRNNLEIFFGGNIDGKYLPEDEYKITDSEVVAKMIETLNGDL